MVIFILLLVVFVNNQASVNVSAPQALIPGISEQLSPAGFSPDTIHLDSRAPFTVALSIPSERLSFAPGSPQVKPEGGEFLEREMPKVAAVLCGETFRDSIESIVVEGYSDGTPFRGVTPAESEAESATEPGPLNGSGAHHAGRAGRPPGRTGLLAGEALRQWPGTAATGKLPEPEPEGGLQHSR
jgi:hypothetical protein